MYGLDASLLQTRVWVLEKTGFEVVGVMTLGDLEDVLASKSIGLLVLCHTLSRDERHNALTEIRVLQPQAKKLLITSFNDLRSEEQHEPTIGAFDGAHALIACARTILGRS